MAKQSAKKIADISISEAPITVGEVIRRVMPGGSVDDTGGELSWQMCPWWPPDLFAVSASIVSASSCYAEPGIALSRNTKERREKSARARQAIDIGRRWASAPRIPEVVLAHWNTLISAFNEPICESSRRSKQWKRAALALLAICDECLAGAGYFPRRKNEISGFIWRELQRASNHPPNPLFLRLPESMANRVPPEVVCVLPKSRTPEVGCTLRSLTHHVALVPGKGVVRTQWYVGNSGSSYLGNGRQGRRRKARDKKFNLLLVPFPYVVLTRDFKVARKPTKQSDGYFSVSQGWLRSGGKMISVNALATFISDLIKAAEKQSGPIHGIVFPEGALTVGLMTPVVDQLAKQFRSLELVITGMIHGRKPAQRNLAVQFRLSKGEVVGTFVQSKHHRWRLERRQIQQYGLESVLDVRKAWWEHIDIHDRTLEFGVNQDEAVVAALVCEDLARQDPVLPVLTAVGPTLVVALLLDGPQLAARWPGRYATVLAEDPGSSILTLTSLGMIARAGGGRANITGNVAIGLWKDPNSVATELYLSVGNHGLVLTLNCLEKSQVTLDHRRDPNLTIEYGLEMTQPVRLKRIPGWLERT